MYIKTGSSTWKNTAQLYIKTTASVWERIRQGYVKISSSTWKRFFYESNLPIQTTGPSIRTTNTSGSGTIYDGPLATSPQYIDADLFGKDGSYTNYISISGRKFTYSDTSGSASRTTITNDDRFTSAGGISTSDRLTVDDKYLFYELTVSNGGDDQIYPVSNPVKMIKKQPQYSNFNITGTPEPNQVLTLSYTIENYYYNRLEQSNSKIRWWRSTNTTASGTMVKEQLLSATVTSSSSTSLVGSSTYTIDTTADTGFYIVAELVGGSSWTRHNNYENEYQVVRANGGIVSTLPVVDIFPTISSVSGYKTKYASGLYTGSTTDGTAYDTPIFRGNTGAWTPNPTGVSWLFQYSSNGSTGWTSFYDFEGIPVSSGSNPDTLENQNHDWYLDDFYPSGGASAGTTNSTGYYVRFGSRGDSNSLIGTFNYSSGLGPIYAAPSSVGTPVISWVSEFDSNNSYISAYWSAATTKFTYYLQYYNGTSWVSLGSGTTSNPTSISQAGPYLVPHGEKNFRVININSDQVFSKSASVLFDPTPPPGNISNIVNRNFATWNSNLFLTTGIRTTSVRYIFDSTNLNNFSIGPFTRSTISSYPFLFTDNLSGYFTSRTWNYDTYSPSTTYYQNNTVWYAGNQYTAKLIGFSGVTPPNSTYWTLSQTVASPWSSSTSYSVGNKVWISGNVYVCILSNTNQSPTGVNGYIYWSFDQSLPNTYSGSNTYYLGNSVWLNGSQYTAKDPGFSGVVPPNSTYWTLTTTVNYNVADYVLYNGTYYFCKLATNGTYPTNTTYWTSLAGFVVTVTPYNGTKAGTASSAGMTILLRPDANTDPAPNITTGPTFSSITQTGFTTTYNPNTAANTVIIDVKKGSPLSSILNYPKTVNPNSNVDNTDSPSNLTADTTHTVYLTPKYVYNSTYGVEYLGTQVTGTVKTLKQAPTAFSFTLSRGGSVTTPGTPSIARVSSTSNTLLFDIASSKPADTFQYGINQSGAAIVNGSPAQYVTTLNQWDSAGNFGSGIYDTITTIQSSANNSEATISTTAYGTTRAAIANVSTTSGATSWAINFSWSGASANGVTYISNGSGTNSASTSATVTVYATSMPVTIATITGANDPTITINNITAYSDANQSGSSTNGSAGATTSLSITRPTATSASTTQYYTYYTPATKLATPTGVSATTTRTDGVNITWNAVANASYYGIWYGVVPGYDFTPDFQNITGTSYLDTSILQGNSRTYYVQAFPTSGSTLYLKSDWSSGATGTRQVPVSQYTVTWNANGGSVSPTSQTVNSGTSVTAPTPTRSGYTFLYWRNPLSGGDPIFLNAGQSYTVVGNITFYAIWQLAGSAPATPTNVSVSGSGLVTWTASSGATSYTVEYYLASNGTGANVYPSTGSGLFSSPDPTGTSYQIAYGTYNGVYLNYARARVRANNANGSSAYSAWYPSSTTYV